MATAKGLVILSHWNAMIEGLVASPKEFFQSVEAAVENKSVPGTKHSRVDWREGGIISAKREYLRIKRKDLAFDICGAPFGNGFFVSWWLGEVPSYFVQLALGVPIIGPLFSRFIKPTTYYQLDTASMFQSLIHSAVLEIIDEMTKAKGLRSLSESDRKPIMRNFFDL
jgi:hypothetical protein